MIFKVYILIPNSWGRRMDHTMLKNTPQEALIGLAKLIKVIRFDREITVNELAQRSGMSRSSVLRFENQGTGSTESLMKILAVLGVLDLFSSALAPPEKGLTIAELKKMGTNHVRRRVRRKKHELPSS
jgi:transcriptional regulator with XRE-family HTH domain